MSSAGPKVILGRPAGQKDIGQRADFLQSKHDFLIEAHGYRLAWSRAAICPCAPTNRQTQQADPSCNICEGAGYVYFNTRTADDPKLVGSLSPVQQKLIAPGQASVIRGIMTGLGTGETPFDRLGRLPSGQASVTVRAENRIGYLDRLIAIDSFVIHTEALTVGEDPDAPLATRYLIDGGVNLLATSTRRFVPDEDFAVTDGSLQFAPGQAPDPGSVITIHYNCHPTYLVIEQPHASRVTYLPKAQTGLATPEGSVYQMPLQAMLRLDWLVGNSSPGVLP